MKTRYLSLLLMLTMLLTCVPAGMFAEDEEGSVKEPTPVVVETTVQEPAPVVEEKQDDSDPAATVADDKDEETPAPVVDEPKEEVPIAPATNDDQEDNTPMSNDTEEDNAEPAVDEKQEEDNTPAADDTQEETTTPVADDTQEETTTPVADDTQEETTTPATENTQEETTTPTTDNTQEETTTPVADDTQEETTTSVADDTQEEEPAPENEGTKEEPVEQPDEESDAEDETEEEKVPVENAFAAGLAKLTAGDVFADNKLKEKAGTINDEAVVYAAEQMTGEGELSKGDIIRIVANIEGEASTLYVKNGRLTYLNEDQAAAYQKAKHDDSIDYRGMKLDSVAFTAVVADAPAEEAESTEEVTATPVLDTQDDEEKPEVPEEVAVDENTNDSDDTEAEAGADEDEVEPTDPDPTEAKEEDEPEEPEEAADGDNDSEEKAETDENDNAVTIEQTEETDESDEEEAADAEYENVEPDGSEEVVDDPTTKPEVQAGDAPAANTWQAVITLKSQNTIDIKRTPYHSGEKAVTVNNGDQVTVLSEQGEWAYIQASDGEGYIMLKFLEKVEGTVEAKEPEVEEGSEEPVTEDTIDEDIEIEETEEIVEGEVANSEASLNIITEPTDFEGNIGDTAVFSIEAENATYYLWKVSYDGGTNWSNLATGATVSFLLNEGRMKYVVKCVVTGEDGTVYESNVCRIVTPTSASLNITKEPTDFEGNVGDTAVFSVEAENATYYLWKVSYDGGTNWSNLATGSTVSFLLNEGRMKYVVKCVVTGEDGTVYESNVCRIVTPTSASLNITKEPTDFEGNVGDTAVFSIEAENATYYLWKVSYDGGTNWSNLATGATVSFLLNEGRMKYVVKCVVTGKDGTVYESNVCRIVTPTSSFLSITKEPTDFEGNIGDTAVFSIEAENATYYLWKVSYDGGTNWSNLATGATVSFLLNEGRMKYVVKCVVTGKDGTTYESNICRIVTPTSASLNITKEPTDFEGNVGDTAIFSIEAENATYYLWKVSYDGGTNWSNLATGSTVSFLLNEGRMKYVVKCVVTGEDGTVYESNTCRIVSTALNIITEPTDFEGNVGDTAIFSIEAENATYYLWQVSYDGGTNWSNLATGSTVSFLLNEGRMKYLVKCIVTGNDGAVYESNICRIVATAALNITKEPTDFEGDIGDTAIFSIEAENATYYLWQVSYDGGTNWSNLATGATVSFLLNEGRMKYVVKCIVTGEDGTVYESNVCKIVSPLIIDNVSYEKLPDGSLSVKSYNGSDSSVVIPQNLEINGISYTVTKIGEGAFENKAFLVSIDLPDTITTIGKKAFKGCSSLKEMK